MPAWTPPANAPPLRLPNKDKTLDQLSETELEQLRSDEAFLKNVEKGNFEEVLAADRFTADVNVADETITSAMHKAVRAPDEECKILQHLIDKGGYIEYPDRDGARPIAHAVRADNIKALEILLAQKDKMGNRVVDLKQVIDVSGHNLLHEAAWFDRVDIARILLSTNEFTKDDLCLANKNGQNVMHVASFRAAPPFLQLLVEHGGDVEAPCSNGGRNPSATPMQLADNMGKPHNAKYLTELGVAISSIRFASRMRAKRRTAGAVEQPSVLHMRIDYDLKLFTADLEKSFIAKLAKHVECLPHEIVVLSKTAGSVIFEIELKPAAAGNKSSAQLAAKALAKIETSSIDDLSAALGYTVMERSVGARSDQFGKSPRATPDYDPMAATGAK